MQYGIGDILHYETFTGSIRRVRVTAKDADIKNGRPGFDGVVVDIRSRFEGTAIWGYDDQIVAVEVKNPGY